MKNIMLSQKNSQFVLYAISCFVFALCVYILTGGDNLPVKAETRVLGQIQAPSDALDMNICGLKDVECDIEAEIREIAKAENFAWPDYLCRLAKCESGMNPQALGDGGYRSRGLFQISAYYHPDVSDECAYDINCATRWTINKINAGQQGLWSCDRIIKNKS